MTSAKAVDVAIMLTLLWRQAEKPVDHALLLALDAKATP